MNESLAFCRKRIITCEGLRYWRSQVRTQETDEGTCHCSSAACEPRMHSTYSGL
jgi:hypothetical protein